MKYVGTLIDAKQPIHYLGSFWAGTQYFWKDKNGRQFECSLAGVHNDVLNGRVKIGDKIAVTDLEDRIEIRVGRLFTKHAFTYQKPAENRFGDQFIAYSIREDFRTVATEKGAIGKIKRFFTTNL